MLRLLRLDAYGLVIGNVTFALVVCILNAASLRKYVGYRQEFLKTFIIPIISSALMGAAAAFVYSVIEGMGLGVTLSFIIAFMTALIVYFAALLLLHGLDERDIKAIPMGGRLYNVLKKLKLMK